MLSYEALSTASSLAVLADRKNRVIVPVRGTPLHELYTAILAKSGYNAMTTIGELELGAIFTMFIDGSRDSCSGDNVVECDNNQVRTGEIAMIHDRVVHLAKESILKQVTFARTVVGPMIESIVASVNGELFQRTASQLTAYRVVTVSAPAVYGNTVFEGAVDASMTVGNTGRDYIFRSGWQLPVKSAEELIDYIQTGSGSVDESIREWIGEKGTDVLREVWNQFFTGNFVFGTPDTEFSNCIAVLRDRLGETITTADLVTALFLLTKRVKTEVPGGSGLGKSTFDATTDLYMKYSAEVIRFTSDQYATSIACGNLVNRIADKTVYVDSAVYDKWLSEGGDVESVMGLLVSKKNYTTVTDINNDAEALQRGWKSHVEMTKMAEQSTAHLDIVRAMIHYFGAVIAERIGNATTEQTVAIAEAVKRFDQEINGYTAAEIKGIWTPLIRSVCRAAYPNTNAEEILLGMQDAAEVNPDISKRELATIVMAKIINRWIVSQLTVA